MKKNKRKSPQEPGEEGKNEENKEKSPQEPGEEGKNKENKEKSPHIMKKVEKWKKVLCKKTM